MFTADATYGPQPGSPSTMAASSVTAAPASAAGAVSNVAVGAGDGARPAATKPGPVTVGPVTVERSALVLLVTMVGAAVVLTQVEFRGSVEVG